MSYVRVRQRKSSFVRLFSKTPQDVMCPHFYELILSNGCPYDCSYCYLRLTFRGRKDPVLFSNPWPCVQRQIEAVPEGLFSTGELADSLAIPPPLLPPALDFFASQTKRYLLLTTKSANIGLLLRRNPTSQVVISFSINAPEVATRFEQLAPPPEVRLEAARRLLEAGWRVRIRLDPVILCGELTAYRDLCYAIAALQPDRVTVGTLRQYPALHAFAREAPKDGLVRSADGRLRYPVPVRVQAYKRIAEWLGFEPALCKETVEVWEELGWQFYGCNCTP